MEKSAKEFKEFTSKKLFQIADLMTEILEKGEELSLQNGKDPDYFFCDVLPGEEYPFELSFDEQITQIIAYAEDVYRSTLD